MRVRHSVSVWCLAVAVSSGLAACPAEDPNDGPGRDDDRAEGDAGPDNGDGGPDDGAPPVVVGSAPNGVLPPGTTSTTLAAFTNEPATCKFDTVDVDYDSMASMFSGSDTTHTTEIGGLADGVIAVQFVRCEDLSGNAAAQSAVVSFRVAGGVANILWSDDIQGTSDSLGFDGFGVEHPVGTSVSFSDASGANLSRETDPLGGGGFAMRHFGVFDEGGARAQAGLYGDATPELGMQAAQPEGVWVAQEWYFPAAMDAGGDPYPWLSVWDWHSISAQRTNRWATSPALMLARDGSMELELVWGGPSHAINGNPVRSTIAMPVGRWFDIEMHYEWVDTQSGTIQVWIEGELAIEQTGVQTRAADHAIVETYMKFYGSTQGGTAWEPTPTLKYTRNVRIAGERIWR